MRIVIDGRIIGWTGIGRYSLKLLEYLQASDKTNEYLVLIQTKDWDKWSPDSSNFKKIKADFDPYNIQGQLGLSRFLKKLHPDLVHFTSQNIPLLYRGKNLATVHDLTLLDYKNVRRSTFAYMIKYYSFRLMINTLMRQASAIITPTNYGKNDILKRYHLHPGKIEVIPEATDRLVANAEPITKFKVGQNFYSMSVMPTFTKILMY